MNINYNKLAKKYDLSRRVNISTVKRLGSDAQIKANCVVVDFGCGTSNFTY